MLDGPVELRPATERLRCEGLLESEKRHTMGGLRLDRHFSLILYWNSMVRLDLLMPKEYRKI